MSESQHQAWSRGEIDKALQADSPDLLSQGVIAAAMNEDDLSYAQALCVRLARHTHFNVRGNAILAFGHLARIHRSLEKGLVHPIIAAALKDKDSYVRGQAECAKEDTELFLGWKYEA